MAPTHRPFRVSIAVLLAGAALVLAGCGGDGVSALSPDATVPHAALSGGQGRDGSGIQYSNHKNSAGPGDTGRLESALLTRADLKPLADFRVEGTYLGERGEDRLFTCQDGPVQALGSSRFAIREFGVPDGEDYDFTVASVVVRFDDAGAARRAASRVEGWLTTCQRRMFPGDESAGTQRRQTVSVAGGAGTVWTHHHTVPGAGRHEYLGVGAHGSVLVLTVCGFTSQDYPFRDPGTDPGGVMLRAALEKAAEAA
ncbi:sensor domain-containing protein [Carbonactinospora thermoautotrophica]|uniref:sensor domain-containing protein n=1 Tax=Carbonactinospora thermoautotrophica TaxID=1469144 RepID=UPI00226E492B|nr:sensor domain-containing protein [Carbonactinospora thermoautotrophica]